MADQNPTPLAEINARMQEEAREAQKAAEDLKKAFLGAMDMDKAVDALVAKEERERKMKSTEKIQGKDIMVGDVIKSAAMRGFHSVTKAQVSSTGNTLEIEAVPVGGSFAAAYRIGMTSKVVRMVGLEDVTV